MEAKELRIGNWVCSPYEKQPFRVTSGHIEFLCGGGDECSINPIPLTPEILEKSGFRKTEDSFVRKALKLKGVGLEISLIEKRTILFTKKHAFGYDNQLSELKHVKYIHQLQNLYFALTGQELEIQL